MHNIVENRVRGVTSSQIVKGLQDHCKALALFPGEMRNHWSIGKSGIR